MTTTLACGDKRGTRAGYQRHKRHGERTCEPCRIAHNRYHADRAYPPEDVEPQRPTGPMDPQGDHMHDIEWTIDLGDDAGTITIHAKNVEPDKLTDNDRALLTDLIDLLTKHGIHTTEEASDGPRPT